MELDCSIAVAEHFNLEKITDTLPVVMLQEFDFHLMLLL